MRTELFEDRVYALTPKGEVIDLPRGATPLDFAYSVHTSLGHRCRGAKVNGRIVPLDLHLANGEIVEIITGQAGGARAATGSPRSRVIWSPRAAAPKCAPGSASSTWATTAGRPRHRRARAAARRPRTEQSPHSPRSSRHATPSTSTNCSARARSP